MARRVRAVFSTGRERHLFCEVHGTLSVVLYTDRHSHRKDVPESISSLSVFSPFLWCGDDLSFSYSLVMRKKLYM